MSKKKVLITGGTKGIGKSISKIFTDNNFCVHITGTKQQVVPDYVDTFFIVDFSNKEQTKIFLDKISTENYDVLINNAGTNIIKPIQEVSESDWEIIHNINLKIPYFITKEVSKRIPNGGKIVNITSIFSHVSKEFRSLYSTTKFGLDGLTKSLSIELGPRNILVNSVSPGFTNTELTDRSLDISQKLELSKNIPLGRFAETSEISELVYFLSSDKNTYITGQNIIIDGGFTSK
jgi:3-oxoacyl-[acyl-carrier protein] reductase